MQLDSVVVRYKKYISSLLSVIFIDRVLEFRVREEYLEVTSIVYNIIRDIA